MFDYCDSHLRRSGFMNDETQATPTPEAHRPRGDSNRPNAPSDEVESDASDEIERSDETTGLSTLDRTQGALEAILLAAGEPLTSRQLEAALDERGFDDADDARTDDLIGRAIERLQLEFSGPARGIHLEEVAGGYQFRTNPDYRERIRDLVEANPVSLSRAAKETLAIVAYRQPITRAEVEEIRGVDSSGVLRTLVEYDLIEQVGRLDDLGQPYLYGTTDRFLEHFGLSDLSELPELSEDEREDLERLREEDMETFDEAFES